MYYTLYPCQGRTRSYTFSIDASVPPRAMKKIEMARMYHPELTGYPLHDCFRRDLARAHQPSGSLSDDDTALARDDGNVWLSDVLREISPIDTAKKLQPSHVAAILHFLGPPPDREDIMMQAA